MGNRRLNRLSIPLTGPGSKLSARQSDFCREYMVDFNKTAAMIRAGYAPSTAKQENPLEMLIVRQEIQRLRDEMLETNPEVTPERIMLEFKKIGFSNIGDFVEYGPNGIKIKESVDVNTGKTLDLSCVQTAKQTSGKFGKDISIGMYDKVRALNSMAEILGMKKNKLDVLFPQGPPIIENVFYGDVKVSMPPPSQAEASESLQTPAMSLASTDASEEPQ